MDKEQEERRGNAAGGALAVLIVGGLVTWATLSSPGDDAAADRPASTLAASPAAAPAGPGSSRFIREARMIGLGQSESDLIDTGRAVCAAVDSGGPGAASVRAVSLLNALGLTADQRTVLVAASVENFCPQYTDALGVL